MARARGWRGWAVPAAVGALGIAACLWLWLRPRGDRPLDIQAAQANLRQLHAGVRLFASERYFGRPPRSLEELWEAAQLPCKVTDPATGQEMTVAVEPLVPRVAAFRSPTAPAGTPGEFRCDYLLVPGYAPFMPGNAIVLLDGPDNFLAGGNVAFADGRVQFLAMAGAEWRRFVAAVTTRSDRDFVRRKCADCSIAGYKK